MGRVRQGSVWGHRVAKVAAAVGLSAACASAGLIGAGGASAQPGLTLGCSTEPGHTTCSYYSFGSAEYFLDYDPSPYIGQIAPTPLLLVVTDHDTIVPTDIALRLFNQQALEPKKVVLVPGEHFEVYTGRGFALSSQAELAWFRQWLMPSAQ